MKVFVRCRYITILILMMMVVLGIQNVGYSQAVCQVGDVIQPGERCTYPGTNDVFSVDAAGKARFNVGFTFFTADGNMGIRNLDIGGKRYTLVTELSAGGGRRITELGDPAALPSQLVPDPNLAAAIREEIGNSITRQTLLNLIELDASDRGITDLTGLEHAHNLRYLHLGSVLDVEGLVNSNQISDLSPLGGLIQLTYLSLSGNAISDITPLAGLTELRSLYLDQNLILAITPLAGLTELRHLSLSGNAISVITPLVGLTELRSLYLDQNVISVITPLVRLTELRRLSLSGNAISVITPLVALTELTELSLDDNGISDITPLAGLTELTHLSLQNNAISDVSPLEALNLTGQARDSIALDLRGNPLNAAAINTYIPAMQARRIAVNFEVVEPESLVISSGNNQNGAPNVELTDPLVVQVLDANNNGVANIRVIFRVRSGHGKLSDLGDGRAVTVQTDSRGYAHADFTPLRAGPITVEAAARGASRTVTFTLTTGDAGTVKVSPASVRSPAVGEQLEMLINITGGRAVAAYQVSVEFDTTALRYVSSMNGDYLRAGVFFLKPFVLDPVVEGNLVTLGAGSAAGEGNGNGTLARLTFEVIAVKASAVKLFSVILTDSAGEETRPPVEDAQITMPTVNADVNEDGSVDNTDAALVAEAMGTDNVKYDTTGDGTVDFLDLFFVLENRDDDAAGAPTIVGLRLTPVQRDRIQEQIELLIAMGDRSPAMLRTLVYLQQLLATGTRPEQTQLLANYPNPFNPETWIPYQLAKDADVTLRIYAVDGQLVRTLALGHQPAGIYQSRHRAAYWDGRNAFGEPVASGAYFYTLTVGKFTATRKMLIRK